MNTSRQVLLTALSLSWLSIPLSTCGTHLKAVSPQLDAYQRSLHESAETDSPGENLAPSHGVGVALDSAWPFVFIFSAFLNACITATVCAGAYAIRNRHWTRYAISPLIVICSLGLAMRLSLDAMNSLSWGFTLLGIGEAMWALAELTLLVLFSWETCRAWSRTHLTSSA